jgi:hypothetical protein
MLFTPRGERYFGQPRVFGEVDADVLSGLQDLKPTPNSAVLWDSGQFSYATPEVAVLLDRLNDRLVEIERSRFRRTPTQISYAIETRPTPPYSQQRAHSSYWHVDFKNAHSYAIADNLPTQTLVIDGPQLIRSAFRNHIRINKEKGVSHTRVDVKNLPKEEDLEQVGFRVFAPKPLEIMALDEHVHRSTTNESEAEVMRTWLRAVVQK